MRHFCTAALALGLLGGCELPPAFDQVPPGEQPPPGTAEFSPVPGGGVWTTDFVGWQFGGAFACGDQGSTPVVVEIWEGLDDPCATTIPEGARVVRLEISDILANQYLVAQQCVGPLTAGAFYAEVRGGQLFALPAEEGTLSVISLDSNDVLQAAFSVRFAGEISFASGGFRGEPATCLTPGFATSPL